MGAERRARVMQAMERVCDVRLGGEEKGLEERVVSSTPFCRTEFSGRLNG